MADEELQQLWKESALAYSYLGSVTDVKTQWPTLTCRWGSQGEVSDSNVSCEIFYAQQVDPAEVVPSQLIRAEVQWPRSDRTTAVAGGAPMAVHGKHILYHPGEVNKVRELAGLHGVVATVTDAPENEEAPGVMVWDFKQQPRRNPVAWSLAKELKKLPRPLPSVPQLRLVGQGQDGGASFVLDCCGVGGSGLVASGGADNAVLVHALEDHMTSLSSAPRTRPTQMAQAAEVGSEVQVQPPLVQPRIRLYGHTGDIQDVVWQPRSTHALASVAADRLLAVWDSRLPSSSLGPSAGSSKGTGSGSSKGTGLGTSKGSGGGSSKGKPALGVRDAHGKVTDPQCVDWSPCDEHLIATGAGDGSLRVWDTRALRPGGAVWQGAVHGGHSLVRLQWHPSRRGVLACGGGGAHLCIWDINASLPASEAADSGPQGRDLSVLPAGRAGKGAKLTDPAQTEHADAALASGSSSGGQQARGMTAAAVSAKDGSQKRPRHEAAGHPEARLEARGAPEDEKAGDTEAEDEEADGPLLLSYLGHQASVPVSSIKEEDQFEVADFQFYPYPTDPWAILSTGVFVAAPNQDFWAKANEPVGSLHVWRPLRLLTLPEQEALDEVRQALRG